MKALEKDRNRRYETANGLATDIQRYLADEPVLACPPTVGYRLWKLARRNKTALVFTGSIGCIVVLAASGLGWTLWERADQRETQRVEDHRRLTETQRSVSVALARAESLAAQARKMPSATSDEAAAASGVAAGRRRIGSGECGAVAGMGNDEMHQQVAVMQSELERGRRQSELALANVRRKEKLFRDLDEARWPD